MSRIATARKLAADTLVTADRLAPNNYLDFRSTYSLGLCLAYAVQQGHVTQVSQSGIALLEETLDSAHFALGEQGQSALDTVAMELAETRTATALEEFANPVDVPRFELGQWVRCTSLATGATMRRRVADISDYMGTYVFGLEGPRGLVTIADNNPGWRMEAELPLTEGDVVRVRLVENGADGPYDVMKISAIDIADEDAPRTFWLMGTAGASIAMFPVTEGDEAWSLERVPTLDEVLEEAAVPHVGDYATYLGATYQVESRYSDGTASLTDSMTGARISAKLSELTIVR